MNAPVEVHFHGIQKSEAIEQRVRDKVAKLEKHFGRMTSCRVVLEAAQRTANAAKEGGFLGFNAERVSEGEQKMLDKLGEVLSA